MNDLMTLAAGLDPAVLFAEAVGHEPDAWQARVLRSTAPRQLLLCSRQSGKSTVVAMLALHAALYRPGSLTLCLAPAERQSKELFRKVADGYRALGRPVEPETENKLELELQNGSRVAALPGKEGTVRGYSGVGLLLVDEASRVPDELFLAVLPMLSVSGGRLVCLSTPYGMRGFFWAEWSEGRGWEKVRVTAGHCPRIDPKFLEEVRGRMGPRYYRQEFECSFENAVDQVFATEDIRAAVAEDLGPLTLG